MTESSNSPVRALVRSFALAAFSSLTFYTLAGYFVSYLTVTVGMSRSDSLISRTLYSTRFGPVISSETFPWTKDRAFALGGASDGVFGALRSLMALRQVLELGCGALVLPEQITVFRASEAFDEMDNLKEERAAASLKRVVARLADAAREMA